MKQLFFLLTILRWDTEIFTIYNSSVRFFKNINQIMITCSRNLAYYILLQRT